MKKFLVTLALLSMTALVLGGCLEKLTGTTEEQPVVEEPVVEEPAVEVPAVEEPAVEVPAEEPVAE